MNTKQKYTVAQIKEAIAKWNAVLQQMDESKSSVLNALEKVFGADVVYSDAKIIPDTILVNKMFNTLNKSVFNNRLPKINILCISAAAIQNIFNYHKYNADANAVYAVYFASGIDFSKITFAKKNQTPKYQYLLVNLDNCSNMSFAFILNSVCHEMIHYLDTIKGDLLFDAKRAHETNTIFNEHLTKLFMEEATNINISTGLTIIPGGGWSF